MPTEILLPDGTVSAGAWVPVGAATLHEATADLSIANYATDAGLLSAYEVTLSDLVGSPEAPPTIRAHGEMNPWADGTLWCMLHQGATEIARFTLFGIQNYLLSGTEYAAITNWADLRLRFRAEPSSPSENFFVYYGRLEVPATPPPPAPTLRAFAHTGRARYF